MVSSPRKNDMIAGGMMTSSPCTAGQLHAQQVIPP